MIKILYAAGNNENSKIALSRFLQFTKDKPFTIKIAAYKRSSPKEIPIDWTLDCLLNIFRINHLSLDSDNFKIYLNQIKNYSPDLIISDMEYFTSFVGNELNIKVVQCSPLMMTYALETKDKYSAGLSNNYRHLTNNEITSMRSSNLLDNSEANLVYSHFGDLPNRPSLKDKFYWVRPYHSIGNKSTPCKHNLVGASLGNDKNIIKFLNKHTDSVYFSDFEFEEYKNITLKNINNQVEYFCNLQNCNLFVCQGQTSFLADAFYNNKYSLTITNFSDVECISNATFSEHFGLSKNILSDEKYSIKDIEYEYNKDIKYLHEYIEEI